jgi:glutaredoxin 3
VVVFSTALCGYCFLAKRLLDRRGIEYVERRLTRRPSDRAELELLAGGGRTFPQILLDGEPIGGFAELRRLDRDGTLERMLSGHP